MTRGNRAGEGNTTQEEKSVGAEISVDFRNGSIVRQPYSGESTNKIVLRPFT